MSSPSSPSFLSSPQAPWRSSGPPWKPSLGRNHGHTKGSGNLSCERSETQICESRSGGMPGQRPWKVVGLHQPLGAFVLSVWGRRFESGCWGPSPDPVDVRSGTYVSSPDRTGRGGLTPMGRGYGPQTPLDRSWCRSPFFLDTCRLKRLKQD